jgi:hypothetical protein
LRAHLEAMRECSDVAGDGGSLRTFYREVPMEERVRLEKEGWRQSVIVRGETAKPMEHVFDRDGRLVTIRFLSRGESAPRVMRRMAREASCAKPLEEWFIGRAG